MTNFGGSGRSVVPTTYCLVFPVVVKSDSIGMIVSKLFGNNS